MSYARAPRAASALLWAVLLAVAGADLARAETLLTASDGSRIGAASVRSVDDGLRPEGGVFRLELLFTRRPNAPAAGALTLAPSFADGWGRVLWSGQPVAIVAGDAKTPGRVEVAIPYPPLPAGAYMFRGVIRDAAGTELATVRRPVGRFERFDFQRDLAWLFWGGGESSDAVARTLLELGINGAGSPDFRFPYRYFKDHADHTPIERYPEDVVLHPEGTGLDWYAGWTGFQKQMASDGGFVLALMTDEVGANHGAPAMRAVRLRLARRDPWMKVPTLSRFNAFFRTDFLCWDEVLREGFPPLDHPQYGANPIHWTADRQFGDIEMPMLRVEAIRQTNPYPAFSPGATHCLSDEWPDSFNSRGYNIDTTLTSIDRFISVQPNYGLRPGNRLINLRPAYLSVQGGVRPYWEGHEHLYWAALANNDRMFVMYAPGDGFGMAPATPDGKATPEGKGFQAIRNIIHPLRPTILATRSQLEPAVVYLYHGHEDGGRNLMDGLVANGIMPRGAKAPGPETKLIFGISSELNAPVIEAVRGGAGLVCGGNNVAADLAALGIEAVGAAPAAAWQEIDLSPLAKAFPGLANVKVMGTYRGDVKAREGSGLEEIRAGGKLLAITGPLGKGWVLYLNFALQDMAKPNIWSGGSWGDSNLSVLTDDSISGRNAALVSALLARAGVPERLRVTDRNGKVHPLVRGFFAETQDGAQRYLYVVSEALAKIQKDPSDPKKETIELACENPLTGAIRIADPAVKAIRDLRTGKLLPLKADAQGGSVDFSFVPGQGTMLALLTAPPAGTLELRSSQPDVAGNETVHVELCRRDERGAPLALPGHSLWVRFLDPQGREVEALTRWATGGGPHVFTAAFALNDPDGEWTVLAEDQTDGTRTEAKLRRQAKPAGPRLAFVPAGPLVRGAPTEGVLRVTNAGADPLALQGATLACDTPGIRLAPCAPMATIPAGGESEFPVTLEIDRSCGVAQASSLAASGLSQASQAGGLRHDSYPERTGSALLALRRGEALLAGARFEVPAPYAVTFEATPYLDGDLILTEIRGTLKCTAAGSTPVTIRLPAGPAGTAREVTVTSPKAYAEVPFAIPLCMTRAQAQAACGLRHEGIELTVEAQGLPVGRFRYLPNILPLERAPQRVGALTGGKLTVKVNNFTKTEQKVAFTLAALPGEDGKAWQASASAPPGASAVLGRAVAGLPALADPGLYDVALDWSVGGVAQSRGTLAIDAAFEQEWWIRTANPLDKVKLDEMGVSLAPADQEGDLDLDGQKRGEVAPAFPSSPLEREKAGWRRVMTEGVVWWADVVPPKFTFGQILVATKVNALKDSKVRVAIFGPTPPGKVWVNGAIAIIGTNAAPVALRQGSNEVILMLELTGKNKLRVEDERGKVPTLPGCSLALLDPATGKRDRTLRIGERLDAAGKTRESTAVAPPQSSVAIARPAAGPPPPTDPGVGHELCDWGVAAPEADPMAMDAASEQEWWIKTISPLAGVKMADGLVPAGEEITLDAPKGEVAPDFPDEPAAREKAGWRRVAAQGQVLWQAAAPNFLFGRLYALTHVVAPEACTVRVAFGGAKAPDAVWVNGARAATAPVALRKGTNTVVLALDVAGKQTFSTQKTVTGYTIPSSCWLVLLDPASGKRAAGVKIGEVAGTAEAGRP